MLKIFQVEVKRNVFDLLPLEQSTSIKLDAFSNRLTINERLVNPIAINHHMSHHDKQTDKKMQYMTTFEWYICHAMSLSLAGPRYVEVF